jgi:hypothetical protein
LHSYSDLVSSVIVEDFLNIFSALVNPKDAKANPLTAKTNESDGLYSFNMAAHKKDAHITPTNLLLDACPLSDKNPTNQDIIFFI